MKKVILTGASGFIGRQTIPYLLKNNCEVHALFWKHKPEIKEQKNIIWHKCNLLDHSVQEKMCDEIRASHLLHFAWYTDSEKYWMSHENLRWLQSSLSLMMNFAKKGGERVVIAGTCAEYARNHDYYSDKETPVEPESLYGECKSRLEKGVRQIASETGLSYAWGRVFYVYGPHEKPSRLVPSVICALQEKETADCTHGEQIRDFLYVKDVASAFVSLLLSDVNGPINIASGRPVRISEVVLAVAERLNATDKVRFGAVAAPENEVKRIVGDSTRLAEEVGWKPNYDLDAGIAQTLRYWQKIRKARI